MEKLIRFILAFILIFSFSANVARASLLDRMPTTATIMAKMKMNNSYNTAIRQYGALTKLIQFADYTRQAENISADNPVYKSIIFSYREAMRQLDFQIHKLNLKNTNWGTDRLKYEYDKNFENEILTKFFTVSDAKLISKVLEQRKQSKIAAGKEWERKMAIKNNNRLDNIAGIAWKAILVFLYILMILFSIQASRLHDRCKQHISLDNDGIPLL